MTMVGASAEGTSGEECNTDGTTIGREFGTYKRLELGLGFEEELVSVNVTLGLVK